MVLGELGEEGNIKDQAIHTTEDQRVAGHLHGHRTDAAFTHHRKQGMQISGLRCGARARQRVVIDEHPCCADDTDGMTSGYQPRRDEVHTRALAIGPRHADHGHVIRGIAVDLGG